MDPTALVMNFDVEAGIRLLEALDKTQLPVKAAFWLFHEESEDWRLYIATPLVGRKGPRAAYAMVVQELENLDIRSIAPSNVSVIDVTDGLVRLLSVPIRTGDDISRSSFARNTINGVYVPAAYIYRMNP